MNDQTIDIEWADRITKLTKLLALAEASAIDWHKKHNEVCKAANHWWEQTQHWTEKYEAVVEERDRLKAFARYIADGDCAGNMWDLDSIIDPCPAGNPCRTCRARALLNELEDSP